MSQRLVAAFGAHPLACGSALKRGCKAVQMIHTGAKVTTEQFTTNATHLTIIIIPIITCLLLFL